MFGSPSKQEIEVQNYADKLRDSLLEIYETVRRRLILASDKMKARYDLKAYSGGFEEGDQVWLYNPWQKKNVFRDGEKEYQLRG
ncbi:hypothetical protein JTB14_034793 [Gonioctena quinquepunctata]|nr:hypothetical protein JTB14_034793 [Gonioctena quinquepunctata]